MPATARPPTDDLESVPGIGPKLAGKLRGLGYRCVDDLAAGDPEQMYRDLCRDRHVDRCVLYVFRCAVYYATHETYDPELLKWWNWTDEKAATR